MAISPSAHISANAIAAAAAWFDAIEVSVCAIAPHRSRRFPNRQREHIRPALPDEILACTKVQRRRTVKRPDTTVLRRSFPPGSPVYNHERGETAKRFARGGSLMKAVLALVIIYVAMFFLAIQGASQNSIKTASQGVGQGAHSIDPAKEGDIRSLMELVGARDAMQDFAAHGVDQFRESLLASVPANDRRQQFVNAFTRDYKAKFNADDATSQ